MIDNSYKNAFKEVYEILKNTDVQLVQKIPSKFINFLQNNMNVDYKTNIDNKIDIDKQVLLPETEDILALIFRSYWATDEEKQEFSDKDKKELKDFEEKQKSQYKDISEIFQKRKNINNITLDNSLTIIHKENFIQKFLKKIFSFFKK